jgi:hypothetical protein
MIGRRSVLGHTLLSVFALPSILRWSSDEAPNIKQIKNRENCSFLISVFEDLNRQVLSGDMNLSAHKVVYCPLCKEQVLVKARDAVACCNSDIA